MVRTQIHMEERQIAWLQNKAKERGVSVSQLVREGIDLYRSMQNRLSPEKKQKALAATGRFFSGYSEISIRHDEFLAEDFDSWNTPSPKAVPQSSTLRAEFRSSSDGKPKKT
jgi:hypothetical protein